MLNAFGKFCRKLRIERDEILKDMANKLGVSSAYLSAVENSDRNIPTEWKQKLVNIYGLSELQERALELAIIETNKQITINLAEQNTQKQEFALKLAREFDTLTEEQMDKIIKLITKEEK